MTDVPQSFLEFIGPAKALAWGFVLGFAVGGIFAIWCGSSAKADVTNTAEVERLRGVLRLCMPGTDVTDLGNGELIGLYLKGGSHD